MSEARVSTSPIGPEQAQTQRSDIRKHAPHHVPGNANDSLTPVKLSIDRLRAEMDKPNVTNSQVWTEEALDQLRKLQAQGLSVAEIGRHLKRSQVSVAQQSVLMGLPVKLIEPRRHR